MFRRSEKEKGESLKKRKGIVDWLASIPVWIRIVAIVFLFMVVLLFLQSQILTLNGEIRELQTQRDNVYSEIDSKNGRLISSADLKTVEAQARQLGMVEAQPGQYVYEAAAKKNTVMDDSPVGLYDYINFFIRVRNENLWPQTNR